jgi:hypothetical protein
LPVDPINRVGHDERDFEPDAERPMTDEEHQEDVNAGLAGRVGPLPPADSTTRRASAAWWTVFLGPVLVTGALLVAGIVGDRETVLWVFTMGVWALTLTLGLAAASRERRLWWTVPLLLAFLAAMLAVALLLILDSASEHMDEPARSARAAQPFGPFGQRPHPVKSGGRSFARRTMSLDVRVPTRTAPGRGLRYKVEVYVPLA